MGGPSRSPPAAGFESSEPSLPTQVRSSGEASRSSQEKEPAGGGLDHTLEEWDAAYRSLPETAGFTVVDANLSTMPVQGALRDIVNDHLHAMVPAGHSEVA